MRWPTRSALLAAVLLTGVNAVRADEGITVTGTGEAKGKPTSVELNAVVTGEAELTADAIVKFNDAKKKAMNALQGLKMANLTIDVGGVSIAAAIDPSAANRGIGGAVNTAPQKTTVTETLTILLKGIDATKSAEVTENVMKIIDTGRDAGLAIGPKTPTNYYEYQIFAQNPAGASIAQFCLDDATATRDQAFQSAMKDARQRAEKLAELAGVKLGSVISVHEGTPTNENTNLRQMIFEMNTGISHDNVPTAKSGKLEDIAVKAVVTVQYQIVK
ncbi:MAG: SIMPL domain-containing protein [Tepidisphaeraceae bacterium]